jgi:hypothetical protein
VSIRSVDCTDGSRLECLIAEISSSDSERALPASQTRRSAIQPKKASAFLYEVKICENPLFDCDRPKSERFRLLGIEKHFHSLVIGALR